MSDELKQKKERNLHPLEGLPILPKLPMEGLKPIVVDLSGEENFKGAAHREWVVSNGIGGYAASSLLGMNTKRTHGLLVASTEQAAGRMVMLSKIEETVVTHKGRFELAVNQYADVIHPEGHKYLVQFRLDPWPTFLYRIGDILLEKWVFMLPGENATVIGYALHEAPGPVQLTLRPLMAIRGLEELSQENRRFASKIDQRPGVVEVHPYPDFPPVMIHHAAELVEPSPYWHKGIEYHQEGEESPSQEDLWSFGQLVCLLKPGEATSVVASTGRRGSADITFHQRRVENTQTVLAQTTKLPGEGPLAKRLSWTSDQFFVRGAGPDQTQIVSSYPEGLISGREGLIGLPGLALTTGRFDLARSVLKTMGAHIKDGLIPVRFSEEGGLPEYDSADTALWYIWATWHYWKYTRDLKFIKTELLDSLEEIIQGYLDGTIFGIGMEEDGLIVLPDETIPLTWMDAWEPGRTRNSVGCAVTPRHGQPVEINALWFCALSIMASLEEQMGRRRSKTFKQLAKLVQSRFNDRFFSPSGAVYDRVMDGLQDPSIRPNALIAASLPFSPLSKVHAAKVLEQVEKELLTPYGVRSLSPTDPRYQGQCTGDLRGQAHALHQGSVWTWLMGPYVGTVLKVRKLTRSVQAALKQQTEPFLKELEEGTLGSLAGLRDGDAPHTHREGGAHAAAVGELLRIIHEAKLRDV